MFASVGFVPLSYLSSRGIPVETWNAWHTLLVKRQVEYGKATDFGDEIWDRTTPAEAFENAFLNSVMDHAFICSQEGTTLSFDMATVRREQFNFFVRNSHIGLLREALGRTIDVPPDFMARYRVFADFQELQREARQDRLTIADAAVESLYTLTHRHLPFFYERISYTIDLGSFDFWAGLHLPDAYDYSTITGSLRPFVGWSLCVERSFFEGDWLPKLTAFVEGEAQPIGFTDPFPSVPQGGRPSDRRDATGKAYALLYPDGHGTQSWLSVLRRVNSHTGLDVSLATLKRAAGRVD
jgi:hypothetical protein